MISRSLYPDLEDLSPIIPSDPFCGNLEDRPARPRILYLASEISRISPFMNSGAHRLRVKSGGLADISATLVDNLIHDGADVHLAIPNYRNIFGKGEPDANDSAICHVPESRIYLTEDSALYRRTGIYHGGPDEIRGAAIAFQREVINHIIPQVRPDIVHCNDWMTGLIPAACKKMGIKTVFSIHNVHRGATSLAEIESKGINVNDFWNLLHYENYPTSFEDCYYCNPIDLLSSAIQNADYVNTMSSAFLEEVIHNKHGGIPPSVQSDLRVKVDSGYASGIINDSNHSYDPIVDNALAMRYDHVGYWHGKSENKRSLQERLGLNVNNNAPVFFWPSSLVPGQKDCQLLTEILFRITEVYRKDGLQLVAVGDGSFKRRFYEIVARHSIRDRVAIIDSDEDLTRLGFEGSDFVLMPSSSEPWDYPLMIGAFCGALPITHNNGGLHDAVHQLSADLNTGNGFVFNHLDSRGMRGAIDQAMAFHRCKKDIREATVLRIMRESARRFSTDVICGKYLEIYQKLAQDKFRTTTYAS